ncbi:MAG TPA: hypothetical protein VMH86_15140 [Rhizomicrobium sp.]|nr:hypothetical protein [Rhizomicrobium sp.]
MRADPDRIYNLLPAIHRARDSEQGYPLRALFRVIGEQAQIIEDDIARLYENWFIETCQDWAVPYLGALIGYQPLESVSRNQACADCGGDASAEPIMIPRREVANTIRYRRRKGTLSVLDDLAAAVSGWPVRAVEFYRQLAVSQNVNSLRLNRGRTVDLRNCDALDTMGGAFDRIARNADVRRVDSAHATGRGSVPELGFYAWRLKPYTVTRAPAYCYDAVSPSCYLFNPLGHDTPLLVNPSSAKPGDPADLTVPDRIRRRAFESRDIGTGKPASGIPFYFGDGRSLMIWTGKMRPLDPARIVPADLSDWTYAPTAKEVAVDVQRGRIKFAENFERQAAVTVSYTYAFSADMGGGEYDRTIREPAGAVVYRVGPDQTYKTIRDALAKWEADFALPNANPNAAIEITDSGVYTEPLNIKLAKGQTLQLRAANKTRPVIQLLHYRNTPTNDLVIEGDEQSWFILDGLVLYGRGLQVRGAISGVAIRHSTLVPGWGVDCECNPERPSEPSLELINAPRCLSIESSIVGAIQIERDQRGNEPLQLRVSDSIVDATSPDLPAISASSKLCADAVSVIRRSTIIGAVETREMALAENSIFLGDVTVCRRQQGCVRFCYLPFGARTPARFECQPDMARQAVLDRFNAGDFDQPARDTLLASEMMRVEPQFSSLRYGNPAYCQLADACAPEIAGGADDESEMGAFHNLFQPQRAANLRTRLAEYTPAGFDAGLIFVS